MIRLLGAIAMAGAGGFAFAALAVASPASAHNSTTNVNNPMWHVGPNPASCNYDPSTTQGPSSKAGEAVFHVNSNLGTTVLDVSISGAVPNTPYDVDIRCTAPFPIGTINTDSYGNGAAVITLPQSLATFVSTNPFFVDSAISPSTSPCPCAGAGGYGDTFISTQFQPLA